VQLAQARSAFAAAELAAPGLVVEP
jgi:hypothetical protein